jgi:hypothetical protein
MTFTTEDLLRTVRAADPLDQAELDAWCAARPTHALSTRLAEVEIPRGRRVPRVVSLLVAALVAGGTGAGVAVATGLIGGPAPESIKSHLAELDRGMPADLRYNADVERTRAVAETAGGVLYFATLSDGGYCLEVASPQDVPRGASCVTAVDTKPIHITAPLPSGDGPLLVGGRANDAAISALRAEYADGGSTRITLMLERSWLLEVPAAHRESALADGVTIVGLDAAERVVASAPVPPLRDDDPMGTVHDADQPLVLSTISDGSDLTVVRGIEGRVNLPRGPRLELRYPDGTAVAVPVAGDGSFRFLLPVEREDDFAAAAGSIVAIVDGEVVASRPVASVAYWRGRNG